MSFLYLLESIRNPVLDTFFSLVTHLGSEVAFMVIALILYWCVDKKKGMLVLSVSFGGTILTEFTKPLFRIARPWVKNPHFTIVEAARADATGYSFPSGHSQISAGYLSALACLAPKKRYRWLCALLIVLVAFSRLYLGVHTPKDVCTGMAIGLCMTALVFGLFRRLGQREHFLPALLSAMILLSLGYVLFMTLHHWPADMDADNLASAVKNGWSLLGACSGMLLSVWLDHRFLRFSEKAPLPGQLVKVILGLGLAVAVKALLKQPLLQLCGGHDAAHGLRYFLLVLFAAVVWPLTFPLWAKLGRKS